MLTEKSAYLRGLYDGMGFSDDDKYAKMFKAIIDTVSDIAESTDDIDTELAEVVELVSEIDEDLGEIEDEFYGCEDKEDCDCDCCDDDDENPMYEITCPNCGDKMYLDEETCCSGSDFACPNCGEKIEIEVDCDCCGDNCDCCHEDCDCEDGNNDENK